MNLTLNAIARLSERATLSVVSVEDSPSGCATLALKVADTAFCFDVAQSIQPVPRGTEACLRCLLRLDAMTRRLYTLLQSHDSELLNLYSAEPPYRWREFWGPPIEVAYRYGRSRLEAILIECSNRSGQSEAELTELLSLANPVPNRQPPAVPAKFWLRWSHTPLKGPLLPDLQATNVEAEELVDRLRRDEIRLRVRLTFERSAFFPAGWSNRIRQAACQGRVRTQGSGRQVRYCVEDCYKLWGQPKPQ